MWINRSEEGICIMSHNITFTTKNKIIGSRGSILPIFL